eukprot:8763513-Pyramimonas_sp.AAC.1
MLRSLPRGDFCCSPSWQRSCLASATIALCRGHPVRPRHGVMVGPRVSLRVETDLRFIRGMISAILVGECIGCALAARLPQKIADAWMNAVFPFRIRIRTDVV